MSLFSSASNSASSSASNTTGDISKDVTLVAPPDDSISELAFSPVADYLAVTSWDKKMRIYQVNEQGQSEGKIHVDFDGPVLSCAWSAVRQHLTCPSCTVLDWIADRM